MVVGKLEKRINLVTFITFVAITAASLLLAGCGNPTSTPALATDQTASGPAMTGTVASAVVQPKVVGTGTDAQGGKIEFTEPPTLNDGIPALLFFETEN